VYTIIVAPKVKPLRVRTGLLNDREWKRVKEDANRIFEESGGHLRGGIKFQRWTSIEDDVRKTAISKVVSFSFNFDC